MLCEALEKYFSNVKVCVYEVCWVFGRFLLQAQSIKYILVAFGLAPAAGIVINKVWINGLVSKETVVLRQWGVQRDNLI